MQLTDSKCIFGKGCLAFVDGLPDISTPEVVKKTRCQELVGCINAFALDLLKLMAATLFIVSGLPVLALVELSVRIKTLGATSFILPHIEEILTPSANRALESNYLLTNCGDKAVPFKLMHPGDNEIKLQAYYVNSCDGKDPTRLIVVCNPNGVGCESNWAYTVMKDNRDAYPEDSLAYLFFDYRGTGHSEGHMYHLQSAVEDAKLAGKFAEKWASSQKLNMSHVTFSGYSLGGGAACSLGKAYPEAQIRVVHTFRSWSHAAAGVIRRQVGSSILSPWIYIITYFMGGRALAPQRDLEERQIQAKKLGVKLGAVNVRVALQDQMIDQYAALVIPKSCCTGPFADSYSMELQNTRHLQGI